MTTQQEQRFYELLDLSIEYGECSLSDKEKQELDYLSVLFERGK